MLLAKAAGSHFRHHLVVPGDLLADHDRQDDRDGQDAEGDHFAPRHFHVAEFEGHDFLRASAAGEAFGFEGLDGHFDALGRVQDHGVKRLDHQFDVVAHDVKAAEFRFRPHAAEPKRVENSVVLIDQHGQDTVAVGDREAEAVREAEAQECVTQFLRVHACEDRYGGQRHNEQLYRHGHEREDRREIPSKEQHQAQRSERLRDESKCHQPNDQNTHTTQRCHRRDHQEKADQHRHLIEEPRHDGKGQVPNNHGARI